MTTKTRSPRGEQALAEAAKIGAAAQNRTQLGVFIGRFQPFHLGHMQIVVAALEQCEYLTILVGSAFKARDTYNPFTFEERKQIIIDALTPEQRERVYILPLRDSEYNNDQWKLYVQKAVEEASHHYFGRSRVETSLVGHSKDHSSFYLKMFPQWSAIEVPCYKLLSATPLRTAYFVEGGLSNERGQQYLDEGTFAPSTLAFLKRFEASEVFEQMVSEFRWLENYRMPYRTIKEGGVLPFPSAALTVDALLVQSGHVLMIRRRSEPGRGLWAMPGGYVNDYETINDAVYRELKEETGLKRETVGAPSKVQYFDAPNRSARGRIVTWCHLFRLPDGPKFPRARAADDADKARWTPIGDIMQDQCFEDHYSILMSLLEVGGSRA